jgi:hypothetical protein
VDDCCLTPTQLYHEENKKKIIYDKRAVFLFPDCKYNGDELPQNGCKILLLKTCFKIITMDVYYFSAIKIQRKPEVVVSVSRECNDIIGSVKGSQISEKY